MFQTRLVREDDALLCFETLAFLIRRFGAPSRPPVPSPLHKTQGLDTLHHSEVDSREVFDWAQDSYATVMDGLGLDPSAFRLVASVEPVAPVEGLLTFDPHRCNERGYFAAQLMLDVMAVQTRGIDPGFEPNAYQQAIIRLAALCYFRQGFAGANMVPAVTEALSEYGVPQRFVESALIFAQALVLSVLRQAPEQIVATYGPVLSRTGRKKVRPACRQIAGFEPELKLLQVMGERREAAPRGVVRPALVAGLAAQPQRISWT